MLSSEERQRAVDLYSATPMTPAQVVEHLGYPTRQCLERWLAKNPGYTGHMAKHIILMETQTKAIEPVPGGMRQKQVCFCKLASTVWALFFSSTGGWVPAGTAPSEPAAPFSLVIWS